MPIVPWYCCGHVPSISPWLRRGHRLACRCGGEASDSTLNTSHLGNARLSTWPMCGEWKCGRLGTVKREESRTREVPRRKDVRRGPVARVFARQTILFRYTSEADGGSIRTHGGPPEEHIEGNRIPKGLSSLLIPPRNRCGGHGFRGGSTWFDLLLGHRQEDVDLGAGAGFDVIAGT